MAISDLFSKRERRKQRQGEEDVFQYDDLPSQFRVQVVHIWMDALGYWREPGLYSPPSCYASNGWWTQIFQVITREKGVFNLGDGNGPFDQCQRYLLSAGVEDALDLIEVTFRFIDIVLRQLDQYERQNYHLAEPDSAIEELNGRFREHGIGYEFTEGEIVRVDSKLLHTEVVRPALQLLHGAGKQFSGPLQEFLTAHARYRQGEHKEAIADALKAFESTMKAICTARGWAFDPHKDTAKTLVQILFDNSLVPSWLQSEFAALRSMLEAGVPTIRNKTSGHGQGPVPTAVPPHFASFVLHLTASNIVFLIESNKALK
jgi:AbiJ N-terminal domain 4